MFVIVVVCGVFVVVFRTVADGSGPETVLQLCVILDQPQ